MASNAAFGSFALSDENGIVLRYIREKNPPRRNVGLLASSRTRGTEILSVTEKSKIITIRGTIKSDTANQTFTNHVRDFLTAFMNIEDFTLSTHDGQFVYEDCVVMNPDRMIDPQDHFHKNFIPFEVELLCAKGVARSISLTQSGTSFHNITTSPYTNEINISGTAEPEPIITAAIDSVGTGIDKWTFLNRDTNEQISISTAFNKGDTIVVDKKNKRVTYNARGRSFSGVLPRFRLGNNRFRQTLEASGTVNQSQTSSDAVRSVFGDNHYAQEVKPDANISVPQVNLLIRRQAQEVITLVDDFQDNSIDTNEWTTQGTVVEKEGRLEVGPNSGTNAQDHYAQSNTSSGEVLETDFLLGNGRGGKLQFRNSDASKTVTVHYDGNNDPNPGTYQITTSGFNGESLGSTEHGPDLRPVRMEQVGSDIHISVDNVVVLKLLNQTMDDTTVIRALAENGETDRVRINDFKAGFSHTPNEDLDVEIQTDSSGSPSGSAVTDGTTTVKVGDVPKDQFVQIPAEFSTAPSLSSGTVYHIVLSQAGGDATNAYEIKVNESGAYSRGQLESSTDGGSTWGDHSSIDMWFELLSSFPTGWNVDLDIDYYITHWAVS